MTTDHRPPPSTSLPDGLVTRSWDGSDVQSEGLRLLAEIAFAETQTPAVWGVERSRFEDGRGLLVFDGDQVVGSNMQYTFATSVPGPVTGSTDAPGTRQISTAGVTFVCTMPSHRRRGLTSVLMRRVLAGLHEAGREPIATLWASEATIYGRFGYGAATHQTRITLPRRVGLVRAELADPLTARLVAPADGAAELEHVAATVRSVRPGMPARPAHWIPGDVGDHPDGREGAGPLRCVLMCSGDRVRAAARYAVRPATGGIGGIEGTGGIEVLIREAYADGPGSHAALWRWLTELDLMVRVVGMLRPVDDPVLDQLSDSRAASTAPGDAMWVRLVDLDRALAARGYAGDAAAVLEVADRDCPWNAGRWRLTFAGGGATVERTDDAPDLSLDVSALGAAYLGSAGTLSRLGRAGRIAVHTPGVLDRLSRSFDSAVQPWAPFVF